MGKVLVWTKNGMALAGMLAIGFWLGSGHGVRASSYESGQGVQFQLTGGIEPTSSLLVYYPEAKTVYLYQGAMQGNSALQCTWKFQMSQPGDVIRRVGCGAKEMVP